MFLKIAALKIPSIYIQKHFYLKFTEKKIVQKKNTLQFELIHYQNQINQRVDQVVDK